VNRKELEREVKKLVHSLRYEKGYICAVDILLRLGYLSKKSYEDWRFGRVEYLEKVCNANLGTLTFINKTIRTIAGELQLESSWTGYNQYGKNKQQRLIFSKSGRKNIEATYATHYIDKDRLHEIKMNKASV
jgi:hypothetical protein